MKVQDSVIIGGSDKRIDHHTFLVPIRKVWKEAEYDFSKDRYLCHIAADLFVGGTEAMHQLLCFYFKVKEPSAVARRAITSYYIEGLTLPVSECHLVPRADELRLEFLNAMREFPPVMLEVVKK